MLNFILCQQCDLNSSFEFILSNVINITNFDDRLKQCQVQSHFTKTLTFFSVYKFELS